MEKIKEYWEEKHKNDDKMWLTGTELQEIIDYMNINDYLKPNNKVLNIGVGLGYCTKGLVDMGLKVDVMDISQIAIDRVKDITDSQFLSSDIENIPKRKYDLIISHLVCQHISDKELTKHVKMALQSLKKDGVFAVQFAFLEDVDYQSQGKNLQTVERQLGGGVIRPLESIKNIVEKNNGKISWISDVRNFDHTIAKWQYVHIQKTMIKKSKVGRPKSKKKSKKTKK